MTISAFVAGLSKTFDLAVGPALNHTDLAFAAGELCVLTGPDGAGKSTLLACLAGHERPSAGGVHVVHPRVPGPRRLSRVSRGRVGYVLPHSRPLAGATVTEGMRFAAHLARTTLDPRWEAEVVAALGLGAHLDSEIAALPHPTGRLAMCAAALAPAPPLLVVDEPDIPARSDAALFAALRRCADRLGTTIVAATSDPMAALHADRRLLLRGGRVVEDVRVRDELTAW